MDPKKKKKLEIIILFSGLWFIITLPLPWIIGNPDVDQNQLSIVMPIIALMTVPFVVLAVAWTLKPELASWSLSKITIPFTGYLSELEIAIDASIKGGNEILKVYETDFKTTTKSDDSPLTEADINSNQIIKKILSSTGHGILSEEDNDDSSRLDLEKIWIIDPLDGTLDFVNKTGEFTVMIALIKNKQPILGVIYWPIEDTLFIAQKGKGAHKRKNDQWLQMFVSKQRTISKCKVVGSRHHLSDVEKALLKKLELTNLSSIGSSLKACLVSSGEADLYFTTTNKMKEWDTAASHCIVSEAGGKMTTMKGEEILYNKKDVHHHDGILVTNGQTHDAVISEYRKFLK